MNMEKRTLCIIAFILVIAGCSRGYTFAKGFHDLEKIDLQFNTSFKTEEINETMIALENVDPMLAKLDEFKARVEKKSHTRDQEALLKFVDIRKDMLLSQKNFILGHRIGDIGLVTDLGGFQCGEAKYILDTSYYYNESLTYGRQAEFNLDDLLYLYRDVPELEKLVGLNDEKTAFYNSLLSYLSDVVRTNSQALEKYCKIRVVTN